MIAENTAAVLPQEETEESERDEYFAEIGVPELTPAEKAEWDTYLDLLLERLSATESEIAENEKVERLRIEMIQRWRHSVNEKLERQTNWLRQRVEMFARGYDFGSKKSRELPHGTFGYRKSPEKLEINDPAKALEFAKLEGIEVKVVETVQKTPLKTYLKTTGIVPEGCELVPESESFFVKTGGV